MEVIATPLVEMPLFLSVLAMIAFGVGVYLLLVINTNNWGINRMLFVASRGSPSLGNVISRMPAVAFLGLAGYLAARAARVL